MEGRDRALTEEELKVKVPKWLRYATLDYSEQLEISEDSLVENALLSYLTSMEALRRLKEARAFPRPPVAPQD